MREILKDHEKKMTMKPTTIIHAYHASAFPFLYFRFSIIFVGFSILCQEFQWTSQDFLTSFLPSIILLRDDTLSEK